MKYPKIQTIWKRESGRPCRIIHGDYSKPEFRAIKMWDVTEKIDGANTRIIFEVGAVKVLGRNDQTMMPPDLLTHIHENITREKLRSVFSPVPPLVVLFGEGYGAKIQKGGALYRQDQGFVLFDVWISNESGGGWWLEHESVCDIAAKLEIPVVPLIGTMETASALTLITANETGLSSCLADRARPWEGIVARSHPLMLFRNGDPIMWKLKVRDYK